MFYSTASELVYLTVKIASESSNKKSFSLVLKPNLYKNANLSTGIHTVFFYHIGRLKWTKNSQKKLTNVFDEKACVCTKSHSTWWFLQLKSRFKSRAQGASRRKSKFSHNLDWRINQARSILILESKLLEEDEKCHGHFVNKLKNCETTHLFQSV